MNSTPFSGTSAVPPPIPALEEADAALCTPFRFTPFPCSALDRVTNSLDTASFTHRNVSPRVAANLSRIAAEAARLSENSFHLLPRMLEDAAVSEQLVGLHRCVESRILSAVAMEQLHDPEEMEYGDQPTFIMHYRNVCRYWRRVETVCRELPGFNDEYPNSCLRALLRQALFFEYISAPKLAYPCALRLGRRLIVLGAWDHAARAFAKAYDLAHTASLPIEGVFYTEEESQERERIMVTPKIFACEMQVACLAACVASATAPIRASSSKDSTSDSSSSSSSSVDSAIAKAARPFIQRCDAALHRLSSLPVSLETGAASAAGLDTRTEALPELINAARMASRESANKVLHYAEMHAHTLEEGAAEAAVGWQSLVTARAEARRKERQAAEALGPNSAEIIFSDGEDKVEREDLPGPRAEVWAVIVRVCGMVLGDEVKKLTWEVTFDQDRPRGEPFFSCHLWGLKQMKIGPPPTWPLTW